MATAAFAVNYDAYAYHGRKIIQNYHREITAGRDETHTPIIPPLASRGVARSDVRKDFPGTVGILGAGPGGLYAALILQDLGIPYHIVEARDTVGGRLFTKIFKEDTGKPYNYYDVGAMRFPKILAMNRVFKLFEYPPLNEGNIQLNSKLKKYYFKAKDKNAFLYFNGIRRRQNAPHEEDPFQAKQVILDTQRPQPYITAGTENITRDVIDPFARGLLKDLINHEDRGWEYMMKYDCYSTRAYMSLKYQPSDRLAKEYGLEKKPLPTDVVSWCETFDKSTGWYDRALSETVLEAIAFGWKPDNSKQGEVQDNIDWFCIDGGAQQIAYCMRDYVEKCNPKAISYNSRVTSIALNSNESGIDITTNNSKLPTCQFSNVISTIPLPVLRTVDLRKAKLSPMQSNALRELNYGPSIKIGMQFKSAWWTTGKDLDGNPLNIIGGQSYTDRPLRTVVYPSFGDAEHGKTTTLIASYCWTEDASRMGALIDDDNTFLKNLVVRELAEVHNLSEDFLLGELQDFHAWSWSHDPYTMGAFAFFGPGKFQSPYKSLNSPAANGLLHFAGEAISVRHAWVEGALDSVWRSIYVMLVRHGDKVLLDTFLDHWGFNAEWIDRPVSSVPDGRGPTESKPIPDDENNLLLKHLMLTTPEIF